MYKVATIPLEAAAMHDPKQLQTVMQSAAADLELAFRPMFGGIMAYAAGRAFASLSDMGLALKLAEPHRSELLALEGAEALRYAVDQPLSKTYVVVPGTMLATPELLRSWIERSIAGPHKPAKPRRRASH